MLSFCCHAAVPGRKSSAFSRLFSPSGIIPTRQAKTHSKLFCIDRLIPFGFIWYQLSQSYGVSDFLLSKSYQGMLSIAENLLCVAFVLYHVCCRIGNMVRMGICHLCPQTWYRWQLPSDFFDTFMLRGDFKYGTSILYEFRHICCYTFCTQHTENLKCIRSSSCAVIIKFTLLKNGSFASSEELLVSIIA